METNKFTPFVRFLEVDLGIPTDNLQLAMRHSKDNLNVLPMILWQYGLVTISQLDIIFDWLHENI